VLGVERVVLYRRVEPEAVAVLAVVEGALERLLRSAALAAAAATASAPATGLRLVALAILAVLGGLLVLVVALLGGT
jgi:hypothetical protein